MTNWELQDAARKKVSETMDKARQIFNVSLEIPEILFDLHGKTAGYVLYSKNTIRFNLDILKYNTEAFLKRTPVHEVAHLVSYAVYGRIGTGHGKVWKAVVASLGGIPERCHSYDVSKVVGIGYKYNCSKCGKEYFLSKICHNKFLRGQRFYMCPVCKWQLVTAERYIELLNSKTKS